MTWVITGGGGQLGTALSNLLTEEKIDYHSFRRDQLDITKSDQVAKVENFSPKAIINCAAWTDVDGAESNFAAACEINRDGAQNLALLARELRIPLIHISTDYVFSGESSIPWKESDKTSPVNAYGRSKLEGERAILHCYPEGSYIIRTSWLYSPWQKNFAKTMLLRALQNIPSKVVNDQIGQPTSAIDFARQIYLILTTRVPFGIYHGTNSGQTSWFGFAQEIYRLAGAPLDLVSAVSSSDLPIRTKRPRYSVLGQEKWESFNIPIMRDWQSALESVFPQIIFEAERELRNG